MKAKQMSISLQELTTEDKNMVWKMEPK